MTTDLTGRVALVTGAGHNIGRAITGRLAEAGAAVAVADVDPAAAEAVTGELRSAGHVAFPAIGDFSDVDVVDDTIDRVEAELGTIDVLVNNAYARLGATSFLPFLQVDADDWLRFVAVNTTLFYAPTQRVARSLARAGRSGSIVNISSHGAARAHRRHIPYDSVKGAMESFTRAVAVDLAPWNIRVNAIRPGTIDVQDDPLDWTRADGQPDVRSAQIPLGRTGHGSEVADVVLFLASNQSSYVTGQIFNVDGGLAVQARPPQVEPDALATPNTLIDFPSRLRLRTR
ncbi:3-oxoacyl-[acyl-carrier protein] reductase [Kribbella aluminosa]|uniref:3-oxoacyl-[acyl-carrier protein] reductase n=1 Tax=Kribbella aluminosa TaxID=416017 RepID=A0ABS4UJ99_9ACTN|nr:SDR family oxidoreductase [Kribbella aluminosa]MBP2351679.1 3-oxoacyl-[acyl-carrier protein] reductase [Kribbella aluminosa]